MGVGVLLWVIALWLRANRMEVRLAVAVENDVVGAPTGPRSRGG